MNSIAAIAIAYLLGSLPAGYLLVRRFQGRDVRDFGSGNIGATNVARTAGLRLGIAVLAIDAGKGFAAVWVADVLSGASIPAMSAAAVAAMIGNAYPVFLGFRGGKTFATAAGAFLFLTPLAVAAETPVFIVMAVATRRVSAGSIVVAATFPLAVWMVSHPGGAPVAASVLAAVLVLWRHRENMRRMREGTESPLRWKNR